MAWALPSSTRTRRWRSSPATAPRPAYLVENPEWAAKDRPELSIDTDDVDTIFAEMSARVPQLLHPNCNTVALKPWGSREFAMLDKTTVCVNFREWPAEG
ncbi:hypothetical protein XTALMG727_3847 [Xanthomonas translucens pv. arrhenatheri LMG 727]|uniref:Uncharacterized protein n=1 Tax=Xanthomonas graminis pv. arrhenatheri LMG 727 TaxID=1195923 RepID=A0A0K3A3G4_9XANT|nr:hypothetical protein XTALMG727_3847 [Xanthomonas translucens pv. arrhenatheri LMG 727]